LHKTSFAKKPPQLRYITQAGGSMSVTTTKELLDVLPNTDIYVMYGQTEASARLTYLSPKALLEKAGSIGVAIPGVELAISDENGKLLGENEPGELIARGDNIMQGYLNNPKTTEQTIIDGWLHTGDLGYRDEDGFYYIKGRQKQMIKSGANRIHPEEIEEVILECEAVSEVSVTGIQDSLLGEVVAAFVILKQGYEEDSKPIRYHCRKNLPPHKQVKEIHWVKEFPRTSSGKIKRHELANFANLNK
jgi:acyl-CoA synthetase (AMP-forming)/AMP-acid ligase II